MTMPKSLSRRRAEGFVRDYAAGRVDRRRFLKTLAAAGVGLGTMTMGARFGAAKPNLTYYTWASYDNPSFHNAYVKKNGGTPNYAIFADEEEALQRVRNGYRADVAHPCTSNVLRWHDAGIIKPVDVSRLQYWPDVYDGFKKVRGVEIDGQFFHVPWEWGNSSVAYRPDKIEVKEESYGLLLDERYKGKMSAFDNSEEVPIMSAILAGAKDPFTLTEDEYPKVEAVMTQLNANMRYYWTDATEMQQSLASGEIVATTAWNDVVKSMADAGVPVKYMTPKEGILTWVCGMVLMKDGPGDENQAYEFMDAMLSPESGVALMENFYYGHSNRKTLDQADPELVKGLALDQAEERISDPKTHFFEPQANDQRERLIAMFEKVKAGL
ncbi:spermidine/putrescine ABC transporter [Hypericibacter adhaerens]|jgi:spermidine/putrescine-binding protein|uniref:Spermidine/putrescine ABC transporter n=2 Tax=Hypericibacter adhaerens TaxID=2602016 RepID=A0A5J6MW16_9PROT|nr:spermidine/putrescine ABC transporter [Hypericibacter adhaerens]